MYHAKLLFLATIAVALGTSAAIGSVACSSVGNHSDTARAANTGAGNGSNANNRSGDGQLGGDAGDGASHPDGGSAACVEAPNYLVGPFDAKKFEIPTGIAVSQDGATAYTNFNPQGKVLSVSLADGTVNRDFAKVPGFPSSPSYDVASYGLVTDNDGAIYVGVKSTGSPQAGVYRIAKTGGDATLFAYADGLQDANKLTWDHSGNLYFTSSLGGAVYKVDSHGGKATLWSSDKALAGDQNAKCSSKVLRYPFGAAGIAWMNDTIYVSNSDFATVVKIPVSANGAAGELATLATSGDDCAAFRGADGMVADPADGTLYVAANGNRITRVQTVGQAAGTFDARYQDCPLDFPASVAFGIWKNAPVLFIANSSIADGKRPGILAYPK